jgi:hypothetical protein
LSSEWVSGEARICDEAVDVCLERVCNNVGSQTANTQFRQRGTRAVKLDLPYLILAINIGFGKVRERIGLGEGNAEVVERSVPVALGE